MKWQCQCSRDSKLLTPRPLHVRLVCSTSRIERQPQVRYADRREHPVNAVLGLDIAR